MRGLSPRTRRADVYKMFGDCGRIRYVRLLLKKSASGGVLAGKPDFAIVEFLDEDASARALTKNGEQLAGARVVVSLAKTAMPVSGPAANGSGREDVGVRMAQGSGREDGTRGEDAALNGASSRKDEGDVNARSAAPGKDHRDKGVKVYSEIVRVTQVPVGVGAAELRAWLGNTRLVKAVIGDFVLDPRRVGAPLRNSSTNSILAANSTHSAATGKRGRKVIARVQHRDACALRADDAWM